VINSNHGTISFETILSLDDWRDHSCPRLAGVLTKIRKQASSSSSSVGTGEVVGDASGSTCGLLERLGGTVQDDGCLG
jgi:hypothetical protein